MAKNVVTLKLDNTDYSFRPYGTCSTVASTAAKTVTIDGFTLCEGATVLVKFDNGNNVDTPSLNVNNTGAKPIVSEGDKKPFIFKNIYYEFVYDGTNWQLIGKTSSVYKHYSSLNIGENVIEAQSKNWYTIGIVSDANPTIYQINAYAHSDVIFSVVKGWASGAITVLNSNPGGNASYAYVDGIRLVAKDASNAYVQVRINYPSQVSNTNITIDVVANPTKYGASILLDDLTIDMNEYEDSSILHSLILSGTGGVYAKTFKGNLTGNADTATDSSKLGGQLPSYYATAADYVKKSGDTMTGDLTIKRNNSESPSIILQRGETNDTFEDWRMTNVGGYLKIQNRGSAATWNDIFSLAPSTTKTITATYSILPSTNNTLTLGNSTYKWKDVYATKFIGSLDGNATSATNIKQTVTTSNASYPLLLAPSGQSTTANSAATYFDSGVTLNPSNNILSGAKVYESLLQWGNTAISGSLSPLDVAMDSQWSSNRLSFMPASGINIEYSTDGGTTWTDYGATDDQKRSLVTTGLSYALSPGKNTTRQKINSDRVRVTITAENGKTYFSLKKIYMYISQNGASGCKVLIEKAQCGSDTTFVQVGEYSISGWSGWNSIPLTANFGGGDGQTGNIRRLRLTYYFTTYPTGYGETDDKSAVKWTISKLNMIGETSWSNSGGNLPATGHIYSYDINKNVTFPASMTVKGHMTLGDATSDTVTISGKATINNGLILKGTSSNNPLITRSIQGSDGNGSIGGPLYMQYGINQPILLGNTGAYTISADGSQYSGNAATATKLIGPDAYIGNSEIWHETNLNFAQKRNTAITTTQGSTTSNRYYGVELDSNGKAFVNVPWTTPKATTSVLGGFYASAVRPNEIELEETNWDAESQFYGVELDKNGKAFVHVPLSDTQIQEATNTTLGGIKVVGNRPSSIATVGTSAAAGRSYGIELDSTGKAFVNIPWTDTKYTFGTALELVNSSSIAVKYDNKTLFAGDNAKDSASITDSYTGHPLQLGKDYKWINTGSNLSNLNNFVNYGIYNISGEHTRNNDNLPINNIGGGNTFQGRLLVYDSSLPNTGNAGNDCCITQVLTLSNRVGGDGNTYIRTGVGSTKSTLTWGIWGKHQTNVEVGVVGTLDNEIFINNGMYSGALGTDGTTFVLITVNNYAIAGSQGLNPTCTQLLYGTKLDGTIRLETRTCIKTNNTWQYNEWHGLETDSINIKTKVRSLATGNKLVNNSIHYISSATTIYGFIEPPVNEAYTYTIIINGISPNNVVLPNYIKWPDGNKPNSTTTGLYEIVITGINPGSGDIIYTATWAKYK